jgi:hypothetical protein
MSGLAESWVLRCIVQMNASVSTVGDGTKRRGEMSPKNLLTTTITDELRMGTNFKGVIGMSLKDRCHFTCRSFCKLGIWVQQNGFFISSSFFMELPDWVQKFNDESIICLISIKVGLFKKSYIMKA